MASFNNFDDLETALREAEDIEEVARASEMLPIKLGFSADLVYPACCCPSQFFESSLKIDGLIKKLPKNLLSPQQAVAYLPQIFSSSKTGNFSLFKSAAASCGVLNPDLKIKKSEMREVISEYLRHERRSLGD